MEPIYHIPTPKTPSRRNYETSRDERLRVQTLYYDAHWTIDQIILQTNLTRRQVDYALLTRLTPQKKRSGSHPFLNTPMRKQLIDWVTGNAYNRRVPWAEIPSCLGWTCGLKAIRTAFRKEGYARRIARRKPPISEKNRIDRLQWAMEHLDGTEEQWFSILWSDETWVQPGVHKKERITRKIGLSEVYHPDCVTQKFQRKIGWMFWGCISGRYGKGVGLFWEKEWKTITKESYSERVIPRISEYLQAHSDLLFQQDNGHGHAAGYTHDQFKKHDITPIFWPACSPDLSPVETI